MRAPLQLLCPACHAPLGSAPAGEVAVACGRCALEVDLSRLGTVAGKPRFLPERDRTGSEVGGYRLGSLLGAGGMGQVYRAVRETPAGREEVAIKFLAAGLAADEELRARFGREVKTLEGLSHPAIVRVLASGEEEQVPWFAMTLVAGPSLRTRLAAGPLDIDETRSVFARVFSALAHAHERGVIHRDLKPANVLLAPEGAVLADFGIARPGEALAAGPTRLTQSSAVLGTLAYMSPEQRAGSPLDRRSDLFSAGVMLYEALTGTLPQGAFALPSRLRSGLPARIDRVVLRLLQPRPEDRFPTAAEAARALEGALGPGSRRTLRVTAASIAAGAALGLAALVGWPSLAPRGGPTKGGLEIAPSSLAPPAPPVVTIPPERPSPAPAPAALPAAAAAPPGKSPGKAALTKAKAPRSPGKSPRSAPAPKKTFNPKK